MQGKSAIADRLQELPLTFTYSQARQRGMSKRELYRLRDEGRLDCLSRGLYRRHDAGHADLDLIEIATKAPRATLCLTTALARHGLSDAIPSALDVAIPRRAPEFVQRVSADLGIRARC